MIEINDGISVQGPKAADSKMFVGDGQYMDYDTKEDIPIELRFKNMVIYEMINDVYKIYRLEEGVSDTDFKELASVTPEVLALLAPLDNPAFTGTVTGINKTMVGLNNVDNTSDDDKPVSVAQQAALDLKAPIANASFTDSITLPDVINVGALPTTDPHVLNLLWNNAGILTISAG